MKLLFLPLLSIILFSRAKAIDPCDPLTEPKAIATSLHGNPHVSFKNYRFKIGGDQEEFVGTVDRHSIRSKVALCMKGTVVCLNEFENAVKSGRILLSFDLVQEEPKKSPKIANPRLSSKEFKSVGFIDCMKKFWTSIEYNQLPVEVRSAKAKIPIFVSQ